MELRARRLRSNRGSSVCFGAGVEVEPESLGVCERDRLELAFALTLSHAELLVGFAGFGGEPDGAGRAEPFAFALGHVFDVDFSQLSVHRRAKPRRLRLGSRLGLDIKPVAALLF